MVNEVGLGFKKKGIKNKNITFFIHNSYVFFN